MMKPMAQKTFREVLSRLIEERGIEVLEQNAVCKGLLRDYAKGKFKREIRLFLQSLEAGYHKKLLAAADPEPAQRILIRSLQEDYGIAGEAAEETIRALAQCLEKPASPETERLGRLIQQASQGDYRAKYELGSAFYGLKRYQDAADWFEKAARQCISLIENREPPQENEFVEIAGGTFLMGSPDSEPERSILEKDELLHQVRVRGFLMGKYAVTQREYERVLGTNPSAFKGADLPVENVSWFEAAAYCNARSLQEGRAPAYQIKGDQVIWDRNAGGYRLPTEAEWEYACRAGTTTPFSTGEHITIGQANFDGTQPYFFKKSEDEEKSEKRKKEIRRGRTTAAGSFAPNPWGLYDMHGNVCEWCWDWYWIYGPHSQIDPAGALYGLKRVLRGGGWNSGGAALRSACRASGLPSYRSNAAGFRILHTAS